MNTDNFSNKLKDVFDSAQSLALTLNHQRLIPEHLLSALINSQQNISESLIETSGGDPVKIKNLVEKFLSSVPIVEVKGKQTLYIDNATEEVCSQISMLAKESGDTFFTVEFLESCNNFADFMLM